MHYIHRPIHVGMAVVLCAFGAAVPAASANIIFDATFDSSITNDPNSAAIIATINQAIGFYESQITNPITVRLYFTEMSGALAGSSSVSSTISYSDFLAALQSHSSGDAVDTSALGTLPAGPNNSVNNSSTVNATSANLRALGFNTTPSYDSNIHINPAITNYAGQTFNPFNYDLLAAVEHEMDEALGLSSNLNTGDTTGDIRPEDLFRYSAPGTWSYTLSSEASSYFSVNGGVTDLVNFNQAGSGSDYGDWASSGTARVQDAFYVPGSTPVFDVERIALDAIGYNFVSAGGSSNSPTVVSSSPAVTFALSDFAPSAPAVVPEPADIWFLGLGFFGLLGGNRGRAILSRFK
jgi:hypothetical protein